MDWMWGEVSKGCICWLQEPFSFHSPIRACLVALAFLAAAAACSNRSAEAASTGEGFDFEEGESGGQLVE